MVAIAAGTINVLGDEAQPGQEADKAKHLYAVVIGVDRWLPDAGLPVLLGPTHDAINVATRLHEVGYTIRLLTPASVDASLKPSSTNILRQVAELADLTRGESGSVLLVYYSGHGIASKGIPYIMPSEAYAANAEKTGVSLDQISQQISSHHGRFDSLVFMVDMCGGDVRASSGFVSALTNAAKQWAIVSACGPNEEAYEDRPEPSPDITGVPENSVYMGYFTKCVLLSAYYVADAYTTTCAADVNQDGIVSIIEAITFGQNAIARMQAVKGAGGESAKKGQQHPQVLVWGKGLDAPFCRPHPIPTVGKPIVFSPTNDIFWLYTNYSSSMSMPFVPAGWMAGGTEDCDQNRSLGGYVADMMTLDVNCRQSPLHGTGSCMDWQIRWSGSNAQGIQWDEGWAGICMAAAPTVPLWWAQPGDDRGHYYDFRGFSNFVFYARASRTGTHIQVKIGPLCRDCAGRPLANGDSLSYPIVEDFLLGTNWQPCQISLTPFPLPADHVCPSNLPNGKPCAVCGGKSNDLSRICSVAFVVVRGDQPNPDDPVEVWLDDIAFARTPVAHDLGHVMPIPAIMPASTNELWAYSDFSRTLSMPFKPYGYMSGRVSVDPCEPGRNRSYLDQMMQVDTKSTDSPLGGRGSCIDWQIHWFGTTDEAVSWDEKWGGLCFIAGRTVPPWWATPGDASGGRYFDLRQFKFLSLWVRAIRLDSHVKVVVGPLARDCAGNPLRNGDSLSYPIERYFTVGTKWTNCRIPLTPVLLQGTNHAACLLPGAPLCSECGNKPNDLSRICSIGIIVERDVQPEANAPARFWIDSVVFTNR